MPKTKNTSVAAKPEDILALKKAMPTGYEMMDSKWQNAEAETIAWQTISAAANNYKDGVGLFSYNEIGPDSPSQGVDNSEGLSLLMDDDAFIFGKHDGRATLIPTQALVDIVRKHLKND